MQHFADKHRYEINLSYKSNILRQALRKKRFQVTKFATRRKYPVGTVFTLFNFLDNKPPHTRFKWIQLMATY